MSRSTVLARSLSVRPDPEWAHFGHIGFLSTMSSHPLVFEGENREMGNGCAPRIKPLGERLTKLIPLDAVAEDITANPQETGGLDLIVVGAFKCGGNQ